MIYLVGAISVISLILNVLIYLKVRDSQSPVIFNITNVEPPELEVEPEPTVEAHDPPLVTVPMVQDVYQGWKNQAGIPWVEPVKPPASIKQAPNQAPLARPDGFV